MTQADPPPLPTLPMQLMMAMGCWLSWPFAWRCAKSASPSWSSGPGKEQAQHLELALAEEAKNRASSLLSGILRYIDVPYARNVKEPAAIWQRGNARLLNYGQDTSGPVVLFIPSLINRYYILDLEEERSMLRYLAAQGAYPLVMDWGVPGPQEERFDCGDYIMHILNAAIDFLANASGRPIILAGYCMGGVLALASATLKRRQVAGLALFATPWDFHCREFLPFVLDKAWLPMIERQLESQKTLPADVIQSLFYMTDPWIFEQKFRRFAELSPHSPAAKDFIALEHWVNDGVPMTSPVARDCLIGWAQENWLCRGEWKVDDKIIKPESINLPTLIAIPQNDHVVPFDCAQPLAEAMPKAKVVNPSAGHVGMIVGSHARRELWQPFMDWLQNVTKS